MKPGRKFPFERLGQYQRILLTSFVAAFLVMVLTALLFEPVRRFLILPMEFVIWLVRSIYLLIPRQIFWLVFLVSAYWIAINSLQSRLKESQEEYTRLPELYGEPKIARMVRYVAQSYRPFYRHRLNHMLAELFLQVFAYRLQVSQQQTRLLLSQDRLDIPPELLAYFKAGIPPWPAPSGRPGHLLARWQLSRQAQAKAMEEAEKALDFLEAYLEVPDER